MQLKVNDRVIDLDFLRSKKEYIKLISSYRQKFEYNKKYMEFQFLNIGINKFIYLPDVPAFKMENIVKLMAIDIEKNATNFKDEGETSRIFEYTSCFNLFPKVSVYCEVKVKIDFQEMENIIEILDLSNFSVMHSAEQKELVNFDMMKFEIDLGKELNKVF